MTYSSPLPTRKSTAGLRIMAATTALALLAGCNATSFNDLDWDLRSNGGSTANEARQATASRPIPDANGVLSYPGYQLATARRGETVGSVAGRLGLSPVELARANALQANDPLREGELLLLPSRVSATPQPMVAANTGYAPSMTGANGAPRDITAIATTALDEVQTTPLAPSASASKPVAAASNTPGGGKEPMRHTVKRGETAFIIARAYNVSAKSLAEWNGLNAEMSIREGQTLIIPVATAPAPNLEPSPSAPGAGSATPTPPSASKPLPAEKTQPAAEAAKNTPASPDLGASRSTSTKFAMPVSGSIIRTYDKKKNQGIDISAAAGSPVKAADAGTVAAITKDTDQIQIVVIRHADNLLTVYAGVDGLKVAKGDKVSRGQSIGALRGGASPYLHFEVRKGVDSLDPSPFLN